MCYRYQPDCKVDNRITGIDGNHKINKNHYSFPARGIEAEILFAALGKKIGAESPAGPGTGGAPKKKGYILWQLLIARAQAGQGPGERFLQLGFEGEAEDGEAGMVEGFGYGGGTVG